MYIYIKILYLCRYFRYLFWHIWITSFYIALLSSHLSNTLRFSWNISNTYPHLFWHVTYIYVYIYPIPIHVSGGISYIYIYIHIPNTYICLLWHIYSSFSWHKSKTTVIYYIHMCIDIFKYPHTSLVTYIFTFLVT